MAQPSTGTTWDGAGLSAVDSRFLERGKLHQALVRDARGSATNISPHTDGAGAIGWSPFAQDGSWRDDLFAHKRDSGIWVENGASNEGFHLIGAFKEGDGPTSSPSIKNDDFRIEQSNWPFDTDLVEEGEPFAFTGVETGKPVMRRLRNNLPLNDANGNSLVELPGGSNAGWSRPLDGENIERQVLLVRQYNKNGLAVYTVEGYALVKLSNIGKSKKDKKDSEAAEMEWTPFPDPYFMGAVDGVYRPIIKHIWVGGPGYAAMGDPTPSVYLTTLGAQSSGTFTLTYQGRTTAGIAYGATNAAVKAALVALDDGYDASDWTVTGSTGGPFTVTTPGGPVSGSGASLGTPGNFVISPVT